MKINKPIPVSQLNPSVNFDPLSFFEFLGKMGMSTHNIEMMFGHAKYFKLKSQQILITPGEICDKVYFVLNGGFVCRYIDEEFESKKTINFYLPDFHPMMSCIDSFFTGTKTKCELRAIVNSEVLIFEKKDIETLTSLDKEFGDMYNFLIADALQGENDLKMKIISYTSENLYSYLMTECPSVIQRVSSKYIAEFMGISQEWLSKLKHKI